MSEQQELAKVYLTKGTEICRNGGAGVAMRHCYLEIDSHPKTRIINNDFSYQVYIMVKECQGMLTGFD